LRKPSSEFFVKKNVYDEFKKHDPVILTVKTNKQAGDIAGTKSKKFFDFFLFQLKKEFEIKKSGFEYNEEANIATYYIVHSKKKDEVVKGPPVTAVNNLSRFKKVHPKAFIKKGFAHVKLKHDLKFDEWFKEFLKKEKKVLKDMSIVSIGLKG